MFSLSNLSRDLCRSLYELVLFLSLDNNLCLNVSLFLSFLFSRVSFELVLNWVGISSTLLRFKLKFSWLFLK